MKRIILTVAELLLLLKIRESFRFSYAESNNFVEENKEKAESTKDLESELPELKLDTEAFGDIVDAISDYALDLSEDEMAEKIQVQNLLEKFQAVQEEISVKKITLTVAEFLILATVKDEIGFRDDEPDEFIENNINEAELNEEDLEKEMPTLKLETDEIDDVIDSINKYVLGMKDGDEKKAAKELLTKFEAVEEIIEFKEVAEEED